MNPSRFLSIALVTTGIVASAATLPYQGLLTDANGVPVPDGDRAVTFGLYSQATGGTSLWSEARTVTTHKGLFSVALGGSNALTDDMFSKDTLFLSITISGSELVSRTPIGMSAFAFRAHKADTAKYALASAVNLSGYATTAALAGAMGSKVDTGALIARLGGYATTTALSGYATSSALANGLGGKVDTAKLTTRLSGKADIASALVIDNTGNAWDTIGSLPGINVHSNDYNYTTFLDYQGMGWSMGSATYRFKLNSLHNGFDFAGSAVGPVNTPVFSTSGSTVTFHGKTIHEKDDSISGNLRVAGALKVYTSGSVIPDYVFEPNYDLAPLSAVEAYTQANKHLPDVPAAAELEKSGIDMAQMNLILLRKVEELTLHAIQQEKRIQALEARSN